MTWKAVACTENRAPPRAAVSFEPRLGVSNVWFRVTDSIWTPSYITFEISGLAAQLCARKFFSGGRHRTMIVPVGR